MYVVCGGRTLILINIFPTFKQYGSCRQGDAKSIPALKISILFDIVGSTPYLVPTQFQESNTVLEF
jgi:hypothetical protein